MATQNATQKSANVHYGTGRRKTSVARVYLVPGSGNILINNRRYDAYFNRPAAKCAIKDPLELCGMDSTYDVNITVAGGGETGQSEACRHGLSRAIVECDAQLRGKLKQAGFLTRDSRAKERKKYGQPGARKKSQFSKR